MQGLLASDKGELTAQDHEVLESLHQHELLSSNIKAETERILNKVTGWNREGQRSN